MANYLPGCCFYVVCSNVNVCVTTQPVAPVLPLLFNDKRRCGIGS